MSRFGRYVSMRSEKKKQDRRTVYTCTVIKDALLALMSKQDYAMLTVADVCRAAEISRSTFYRHYDNLRQVIDEAFSDARSLIAMLDHLSGTGENKPSRHMCVFLRKNRKYIPLFLSPAFRGEAVNWFISNELKLRDWLKSEGKSLDDKELRTIMFFQLNGCLALVQENLDVSDEEWERIKNSVDSFLIRGMTITSR